MATGEDWSRLEVEACVADYLQMLELELNGQQFNKSARIQALVQKLDGRSKASVEYKFRNVSAVMQELQWPTVSGYKALANYQLLLLEVIEAQLLGRQTLQVAAEHAVTRPATVTETAMDVGAWVPRPEPKRVKEAPSQYAPRFSPARRDYLARESHNRSLGKAGELFVMELDGLPGAARIMKKAAAPPPPSTTGSCPASASRVSKNIAAPSPILMPERFAENGLHRAGLTASRLLKPFRVK